MISPRTNPFTRTELVDHARRVHGGHLSIVDIAPAGSHGKLIAIRDADLMEQMIAVLENYPHSAQVAAEHVVNVVLGDLSMRRGFDDLILGLPDLTDLRAHLAALVVKSTAVPPAVFAVVSQGTPVPPTKTDELEFA